MIIEVENVKCDSCARTIKDKMHTIIGIDSCSVDVDKGYVELSGASINTLVVVSALKELGFPEKTPGGLFDKAKSLFSGITGISNKE